MDGDTKPSLIVRDGGPITKLCYELEDPRGTEGWSRSYISTYL